MTEENLFLLAGISVLLVMGILSDKLSKSNNRFPRLIALIIGGALIQLFVSSFNLEQIVEPLTDIEQVRFFVELTLSLILFREGLYLNLKAFRRSIRSILILAFGGVILSSFIFAFTITLLTSLSIGIALLIAGILAPTDPAATYAMFKGGIQLKEKEKNVLGAESALNDAVAIVLVIELFLHAAEDGNGLQISPAIILAIFSSFFGGILLGYVLGMLFLYINNHLDNFPQSNLLSLALMMFSFVIPFLFFDISGIPISAAISSLTAGSVFGNPQFFGFPRFSKTHLNEFHEGISEIGEILAFGALGLLISFTNFFASFTLAIFFAILTLGSRYIVVVYLLRAPSGLTANESKFIAWGGMRGLATGVLAAIAFERFVLTDADNNLPIAPEAFLTTIVLTLLIMTIVQGSTLKFVGNKTNSIIVANRKSELLVERRILISKLAFYQKERDEGSINISEYKEVTIPIRDELTSIFQELQKETVSRSKHMLSLVKELELQTTIISDLGLDADNIEFHEKYQEIKDEETSIISHIEVELNVLKLEMASEKTRSVDKRNYIELLNNIREKVDAFGTSKAAQRLVTHIDSLIPVEEKPVEEESSKEEQIEEEPEKEEPTIEKQVKDEPTEAQELEDKSTEKVTETVKSKSKDDGPILQDSTDVKSIKEDQSTAEDQVSIKPKIKKE